jgi:uncharacterized protein (TIGR02145 family)
MKSSIHGNLILIFLIVVFPISCKKEKIPTVTTSEITYVKETTATGGGTITENGNSTIISRGVCWSTESSPAITGNKTTDNAGTGTFTSNITGLNGSTIYFLKAYATNSEGTGYGNLVSFRTLTPRFINFNPDLSYGILSDVDGNTYKTIQIGNQTWMAENLKTTRYNDGTEIPFVPDNISWYNLTTPAYCWNIYDEASTKSPFGALYNWYSINSGKLCPAGWHVPTDAEWTTLTTSLGESVAGGKLKETGTTHWTNPNVGASNQTGFTALPGGGRDYDGGSFVYIEYNGVWWSSTEGSADYAWGRNISYYYSDVLRGYYRKKMGFSVRCLKD